MVKTYSKRIICYSISLLIVTFAVLLVILIYYFLFSPLGLSKQEKNSEFVFNPHSEYWPTKNWKTSTPEKQGMSSEALTEIFDEIEDRKIHINSLLIVRNGYVVVEANKRHEEALYSLASGTKSFTSAIFGIALNKGYIKSTDQPVLEFFPEFSKKNGSEKRASITLKHLLTMTCGFDWPEAKTSPLNPENPLQQMLYSENWSEFVLSTPVEDKPGSWFNYNSGCSHLLLAVLNQTGLNVADFTQNNLFTPLGINTYQYNWSQDPNGIPRGCHGLQMRPRDMAKFGYLYLKGGHWEGKQIIPKTWIEESTIRHINFKKIGEVWIVYGYQWWIHSFGFSSRGYGGQIIFVIPKHELVVVFTSNLKHRNRTIPNDFVKKYIIPAIKSSEQISENEEALTLLRSKINIFNKNK